MSSSTAALPQTRTADFAGWVRSWWATHGVTALRLAVAVLSLCAMLKLGEGFWRLLSPSSATGANDLKFRHAEVQQWFARQPVYTWSKDAVYPPASYALLRPLLGWLDLTGARQLWAGTSVLLLASLTYLLVKGSGATTAVERALVALLVLSMNATGLTIGNGQLTLHVLAPLLAAVLFVRRAHGGWAEEVVVVLLLLVSMVKPTGAVPFFWMVLFSAGGLRRAVLVGVSYAALTLLAAAFQPAALSTLFVQWFTNASAINLRFEYANVHVWLATLGMTAWSPFASLLVLVALGIWTYRHRQSDLWVVLGVTGLVTRFWTYHLSYDDLWTILPCIALFKLAKSGSAADGRDVLAGILLAAFAVVMVIPETVNHLPLPWSLVFSASHTIVWAGMLVLLLACAWRVPPQVHALRAREAVR